MTSVRGWFTPRSWTRCRRDNARESSPLPTLSIHRDTSSPARSAAPHHPSLPFLADSHPFQARNSCFTFSSTSTSASCLSPLPRRPPSVGSRAPIHPRSDTRGISASPPTQPYPSPMYDDFSASASFRAHPPQLCPSALAHARDAYPSVPATFRHDSASIRNLHTHSASISVTSSTSICPARAVAASPATPSPSLRRTFTAMRRSPSSACDPLIRHARHPGVAVHHARCSALHA
jgi:hypothetical protein